MINPYQITNYDRSSSELEEFLLFCIVVAGKTAYIQAQKLEDFLLKHWQNDDIASLSYKVLNEEFSPFTDVRASSEYRLQVSANLVKKTILMYLGESIENLAEYTHLN